MQRKVAALLMMQPQLCQITKPRNPKKSATQPWTPKLSFLQHQANLGILDGSGKSLIMRWVEAVTSELQRYANWPIRSLKLDDLMASYQEREFRDACLLSYSMEVAADSGAVQAVTVSSAAANGTSCLAPLMLGGSNGSGGGASVPQTIKIPLASSGSARVAMSGLVWRQQRR